MKDFYKKLLAIVLTILLLIIAPILSYIIYSSISSAHGEIIEKQERLAEAKSQLAQAQAERLIYYESLGKLKEFGDLIRITTKATIKSVAKDAQTQIPSAITSAKEYWDAYMGKPKKQSNKGLLDDIIDSTVDKTSAYIQGTAEDKIRQNFNGLIESSVADEEKKYDAAVREYNTAVKSHTFVSWYYEFKPADYLNQKPPNQAQPTN